MPIGATELVIILIIVLVLFGARRVPELGRSLGTGMREFKDSVTGKSRDDEEESRQLEKAEAADRAAKERQSVESS